MDQKPSVKRRVLIFLAIFLGILFAINWINSFLMGGQFKESPDGRYVVDIKRKMAPWPSDPFWVSLKSLPNENIIYKFAIYPVNGGPNRNPRGQPGMIEWDPASKFAELTLDGRKIYRVYVP